MHFYIDSVISRSDIECDGKRIYTCLQRVSALTLKIPPCDSLALA